MTVDVSSYNESPSDPNTILAIAKKYSEANMHDLCLLFVEKGLEICDDSLRNDFYLMQSICGFYSKQPQRVISGRQACEILATDPSLPWSTRNNARQNSTYYCQGATQIMPSTNFQPISFIPPDDYKAMNPSISRLGDQLWMIQRTVNYVIRPDGSYDMRGDTAIRTRNHLLRLDDDLNVISSEEILPPENSPQPLYDLVLGFEDCRLFFIDGNPSCTSTVREMNDDGYCEIVMSDILRSNDGRLRFANPRTISPDFCSKQHEKNWMPLVVRGEPFFVYSTDPTRIVNKNGSIISQNSVPLALDSFRGGSPLVRFDDSWMAIIHESHTMPDSRRRYIHRFVTYDDNGVVKAFSPGFYIKALGIEFAAGMAVHPKSGDVIVSFGLNDCESWLATFSADEIRKILTPCA